MESETQGPEQRPPSFIQAARRQQLVDCAVEVIAELGAERASIVRIAQRAGVSRGVVTYHFRDRDDLFDRVVEEVYRIGEAEVGPPVRAAETPRDALLAFVGGSVDFYARHPAHMTALVEIFAADRHSPTRSRDGRAEHHHETADLAAILAEGQRGGQFRSFDIPLMILTLRAVLDAAVRHVTSGGDAGLLSAELRRTCDVATRKETS